jgi:hypothetical protein
LNRVGLSPAIGNNEKQTKLKASAFLLIAADIFHHDFPWISDAGRAASCAQNR